MTDKRERIILPFPHLGKVTSPPAAGYVGDLVGRAKADLHRQRVFPPVSLGFQRLPGPVGERRPLPDDCGWGRVAQNNLWSRVCYEGGWGSPQRLSPILPGTRPYGG